MFLMKVLVSSILKTISTAPVPSPSPSQQKTWKRIKKPEKDMSFQQIHWMRDLKKLSICFPNCFFVAIEGSGSDVWRVEDDRGFGGHQG